MGADTIPAGLAVDDFNSDGHPDIAVANMKAGTVTLWLGSTEFTFAQPPLSLPVGKNPFFVATADLDGDGHPDIVVTNVQNGNVGVLWNDCP